MKRRKVVSAIAFMVRQAHHEGSPKGVRAKGLWYQALAFA
jgi:hypothetical protein